jgi:D-lactate dehydrogenase
MRVAIFDSHRYDKAALLAANRDGAFAHDLVFFENRLSVETAALATHFPAVCVFVNDLLDRPALARLREIGVGLVALRCAGYNKVCLEAAAEFGLKVVRVPEYSPHAVAEHAVALLLAVNRHIHRAFYRVRDHNFSLEGLVGFDLYGKKVGVIGAGRIGRVFAEIMRGFGCHVRVFDPKPDAAWATAAGVEYAEMGSILAQADILSLHVPLFPGTRGLLNAESLAACKRGVLIINTSRGELIDTPALIEGLKTGQIGGAGLDVYEEEEGIFFEDVSHQILQDDVLARLLSFPNVLVTSHQAFLTREALRNIAMTTLGSIQAFARGEPLVHEVVARKHG